MNRGRTVPTEDIVEILWPNPDNQPDDPKTHIRVVISRLNKKIPGIIVNPRRDQRIIPRPDDNSTNDWYGRNKSTAVW